MTFEGSVADINAALDQSSFDPLTNYVGSATVTFLTDDLGNTGSGGSETDLDSFNIGVTPVNDAPNTGTATASGAEDTLIPITISGADIDGTVTDFVIQSLPGNGKL